MNYWRINSFKNRWLISFIACVSIGLSAFVISLNVAMAQEIDLKRKTNISADTVVYTPLKNSPNKAILDSIPDEVFIPYLAENEKFTVTIFTDVFCPYCRRLHENLADFLDNGISVRFAPFPLIGQSYPVLTSIWCAQDQKFSLDMAMLEFKMQDLSCDIKYIEKSLHYAKKLKVGGTPSIYFEDGRKVSGFFSALDINAILTGRAILED